MTRKKVNLKEKLEELNVKYDHKNDFLSKDLLTIVNKISSSRTIMFSSQLEQLLVLDNPEFPRVYTNFENEVGSYCSSIKKLNKTATIIDKFYKFGERYKTICIYLIQYKDGKYDIIEDKNYEKLTEDFCYMYNSKLHEKNIGDKIRKNEIYSISTSFDKENNYCYGINANAVYMILNDTIEDAVMVSESFSKRMKSSFISEIEVNMNNNDIMCNLYGTKKHYKGFPDIGETVKNRVLLSRRRINYEHALYDLKMENLNNINYEIDSVFYANGIVIDIDLYCNQTLEELSKSQFNEQIISYYINQNEYYKRILKVLTPIVKKHREDCSDDLLYLYSKAKDNLSGIKWTANKSEFDNLIIKFKVAYKRNLDIGSKIAGRFGDKGVISKIVKDDEMPYTIDEDGNKIKVEVILNAFGVLNRLNAAQLYSHELSFIADNIVRKIKKINNIEDKFKYLDEFYSMINKEQHEIFKEYHNSLDKEDKKLLIEDIEENGIYIYQPPFWDNISLNDLAKIYDKYDFIKPYKCYVDVNGVTKEILNPLIIGKRYLMMLKHHPSGKFSARSSSYINLKDAPSKSLAHKNRNTLFSNTPIRIGEMEINNLLISRKPKVIAKLLSMLSTSKENRTELIRQLLTKDVLTLDKIKLSNPNDNYNKKILDVYLKSLGLVIDREYKE